jgi:hypothetical protein
VRALGARVGATDLTPEKRGPPGPAIYGCLHALLQGFAVGRDRLRRPLGRAGLALHHRQSRAECPDTLGGRGYCLCHRSLEQAGPSRRRENDPSGVQMAALAQLCLSAYETCARKGMDYARCF